MVDFKHLDKYKVQADKPRKFTFRYADQAVSVYSLPASNSNPDFLNHVSRSAADLGGGKRTAAQGRQTDSEAIAATCIKSWDEDVNDPKQNPVTDAKGNAVKFSVENAEAFLKAIAVVAPYAFDEFRQWAVDDRNFVPTSTDGGVTLGN